MKSRIRSARARVVVIGGGIAGLAAAYRLSTFAPDMEIILVERERRLGGKIRTERTAGFIFEAGADSFLSRKPRGVGLCAELGLADRLHGRDPRFNQTYVQRGHRLYPLPQGLTGMIPTSLEALTDNPLLSEAGRERLAQETRLPPARRGGDESVAHFVRRRLGDEAYENIVEPLMSGIYAGDGEQLSLAATFPQLRQLELRHGSLIRGLQAGQRVRRPGDDAGPAESRYPPFVSLPEGMAELVERLVVIHPADTLLLGRAADQIIGHLSGFTVVLADGERLAADAVIVATPAYATARLVADLDRALAEAHAAIPYASTAIVNLGYEAASLPDTLQGYGYVVPSAEQSDVLACSWTWRKWSNRAPDGYGALRVYLGRYGRPDILERPDETLVEMAREELRQTLGITAAPETQRLHRWPRAMPQYTLGHLERVGRIEERTAELPGLFLAGAAYRGVGIPDCIQSGEQAAQAVLDYLGALEALLAWE